MKDSKALLQVLNSGNASVVGSPCKQGSSRSSSVASRNFSPNFNSPSLANSPSSHSIYMEEKVGKKRNAWQKMFKRGKEERFNVINFHDVQNVQPEDENVFVHQAISNYPNSLTIQNLLYSQVLFFLKH